MAIRPIGPHRAPGQATLAWRLFHQVYKKVIRPALPIADPILYAGIPVGHRKVGDARFSRDFNDAPGYEQALVTALKANVGPGDRVVIVGGGLGVTSVIAATAAGASGHVDCYEGDRRGMTRIRQVARLNVVSDRITAHHAIVGKAIAVSGNAAAARSILPCDMPDCDVLELDCEGSEIGILSDMVIRPGVILVETHGFLGAPTDWVRAILEARGYHVDDLGWAEPRFLNACVQNDIRVLIGRLRQAEH
jgi:hypothetical protein